MCEVPAKLNVNRTQSSYSDAEPNFFPNISKCSVFNVCITIKKVIEMKKVTISLTRTDLNLIVNNIYDVLGYLAKDEVKNYCTHL